MIGITTQTTTLFSDLRWGLDILLLIDEDGEIKYIYNQVYEI